MNPQPKPAPSAVSRKAKRRQIRLNDEAENKEVRKRSGGRCEAVELETRWAMRPIRCVRPATEIHHMIGGWRIRGRDLSKMAAHKQHLCAECHRNITTHRLRRIGDIMPHHTDAYERTR